MSFWCNEIGWLYQQSYLFLSARLTSLNSSQFNSFMSSSWEDKFSFFPCVLRSLQEMVAVTIYLMVILAQAFAGPCTPNKAGRITQVSQALFLYFICQSVVFHLKLVVFSSFFFPLELNCRFWRVNPHISFIDLFLASIVKHALLRFYLPIELGCIPELGWIEFRCKMANKRAAIRNWPK